jgi:hypothetical protein
MLPNGPTLAGASVRPARQLSGAKLPLTLCIAAYGFLISERETIPPSGVGSTEGLPEPAIPRGYRPRGSTAAAATARTKLDCRHAPTTDRSSRHRPAAMPLLRRSDAKALTLVTQ